ncbi:hypothetical protein PILCRDRAFT_161569 [Piloderma croceum F 1598]|uniref:Uncharacterized protein n=1 Tax=Piloderma croceum (strain F 1598) TaxID=765440 RepID=A0A0C3BWW4_PILCF|nr:hypothetical protein PILCRDRAFT_161569 [Piloderma croceum F 1598]
MGIFHSTATLSIQRVPVACMGFGSCTVSIFPCPASATLAGQATFFRFLSALTLTLRLFLNNYPEIVLECMHEIYIDSDIFDNK